MISRQIQGQEENRIEIIDDISKRRSGSIPLSVMYSDGFPPATGRIPDKSEEIKELSAFRFFVKKTDTLIKSDESVSCLEALENILRKNVSPYVLLRAPL